MIEEQRANSGLAPAYEFGGWVEYLMTTAGPEPYSYVTSTLDYNFYIERQLAPIADAVLSFRGSSLAALIDKQLGLF